MMSQFYIGNDDAADVQKCKESRDSRTSITITGRTTDGFIKAFHRRRPISRTRSRVRSWGTLACDHPRSVMRPTHPADDARQHEPETGFRDRFAIYPADIMWGSNELLCANFVLGGIINNKSSPT
jgi:hypothetical protein